MKAITEAYTTSQVVGLTGVPRQTLHTWVCAGAVSPSVQQGKGRGSARLYSRLDVLGVLAARALRDAGAGMEDVRAALACLRDPRQGGAWLVAAEATAWRVATPEALVDALEKAGYCPRVVNLRGLARVLEARPGKGQQP